MASLIDELRQEHLQILERLRAVQQLGIGTPEATQMLMAARAELLAHLEKEDARLYPALRRSAEWDEALRQKLDTFAKDMEGVSKAALEFFDACAAGGKGTKFAEDFGRLLAALGSRIRREEAFLYPEYDRLPARKDAW